jgi:hypothetical protein
VRTRFVGIPRCLHAAPSHPTSSYTLLPHPTPVPSHLTAPFHPTPTPLPSHYHPSPLPLPVPPTPILYCSRWVMAEVVGCCVQCTRRVSGASTLALLNQGNISLDYEMVVTNVRSLITHLLDAFFGFYYDG